MYVCMYVYIYIYIYIHIYIGQWVVEVGKFITGFREKGKCS